MGRGCCSAAPRKKSIEMYKNNVELNFRLTQQSKAICIEVIYTKENVIKPSEIT